MAPWAPLPCAPYTTPPMHMLRTHTHMHTCTYMHTHAVINNVIDHPRIKVFNIYPCCTVYNNACVHCEHQCMHLELLIFPHWAYRSAPPSAVQNHTSHIFLHVYVHTRSRLCLQVHIHIQVHTHIFVHVYAGMGTGVCSCVCMQGWRPRTKFSFPVPGAIHLCFLSL